MKSLYLCLVVFCATIALPGCGDSEKEPQLANEGITVDEIAKYEADLAAVTGDDAYAEELAADDDDAGAEAASTGDAE